jgi:KUP system potassium uptake protein
VPRVSDDYRLAVEHLEGNFHRVLLRYGFMEEPDVPRALARYRFVGQEPGFADASFFLSREILIPSVRPDLSPWRERIFILLSSLALPATEFFHLPPDRVIEVGTQVEI